MTTATATTKRPFQFSLRKVFVVITLVAVVLAGWVAVSRERVTVREGQWTWHESRPRFGRAGANEVRRLTWNNASLPESLLEQQVTLITPLGRFEIDREGRWDWRQASRWPPHHFMHPAEAGVDMPALLAQGYYDSSRQPVGLPDNAPWLTTQLTGTPADWVYSYKETPAGHIGYWADPAKLGELEWER